MVLRGWKWSTSPDYSRSSRSSSNRPMWALKRTLPLVAEWIKREFSITISVREISAMLKQMNFSFTKATYILAKAEEDAQAFFNKDTSAQFKKQVEDKDIDHLLFEDESTILSYQILQYNWFLRGKQRKVPTYGKHEGAKLFEQSIMKQDRCTTVKKKRPTWPLLFGSSRVFCRRTRTQKSP
ncbi:winged helix-turn-helix domain-containing protein [Paenibacillus polymyxa]|uniref:winged helix-turn-helix domain-containing protein n=1 Tax=Paenibacillus polymyxa TaxID=1406 RepID=UPI002AB507DC|nr:winged helix-turn-helix domain-containing protein [Paenibacillus polymyxa]MDY8022732.1 winged helix-turn-helix domain-containing protein [Paenibacillus polymyxa]